MVAGLVISDYRNCAVRSFLSTPRRTHRRIGGHVWGRGARDSAGSGHDIIERCRRIRSSRFAKATVSSTAPRLSVV